MTISQSLQLDTQNAFDVLDEVGGELEMTDYGTPTALLVPAPGGAILRIEIGDYIIREPDGRYFTCKPDVFHKNCEKVQA